MLILPTDPKEHEVNVGTFLGDAFLETKVFEDVVDFDAVSTCCFYCVNIMFESSYSQSASIWSRSKFGSAGVITSTSFWPWAS